MWLMWMDITRILMMMAKTVMMMLWRMVVRLLVMFMMMGISKEEKAERIRQQRRS